MAYVSNANQILTSAWGQTAGANANREDLANVMTLTDPTDTPGMARFEDTDSTGITHEWLDRGLKNPKLQQGSITDIAGLTGGVLEGSDFNPGNRTVPNRRKNTNQIFKEDFQLSRSQVKVLTAGVRDKFATEARIATQEILRACEARMWMTVYRDPGNLWGDTAGQAQPSTGDRLLSTFDGIIGHSSSGNVVTLGAAGAPAAVTEDDLLDLFMLIADDGGKSDLVMCHHRQKRRLNRLLTGIGGAGAEAPLVRNAPNIGVVPGTVRGYESDLGDMDIVGNRWVTLQTEAAYVFSPKGGGSYQSIAESDTVANGGLNSATSSGRIWVLTSGLIKTAWLDKPHVEDIAKKGDALYGMVVGEMTLEVNAPFSGHGVVKNVAN